MGDAQQIADASGQVAELQVAPGLARGCQAADQFAKSGAVHIGTGAEVDDEFGCAVCQLLTDGLVQYGAVFAQQQTTAQSDDADFSNFFHAALQGHSVSPGLSDMGANARPPGAAV